MIKKTRKLFTVNLFNTEVYIYYDNKDLHKIGSLLKYKRNWDAGAYFTNRSH